MYVQIYNNHCCIFSLFETSSISQPVLLHASLEFLVKFPTWCNGNIFITVKKSNMVYIIAVHS